MSNRRVAVCGPVGSGKTTVGQLLSKELKGSKFHAEPHEDNPFLPLFYESMAEYALRTQLKFWLLRLKKLTETSGDNAVLDRCCWEDWVFAKRLHNDKLMSDEDFELYQDLFDIYMKRCGAEENPTAIVFLRVDCKQQLVRIRARGRDMESAIDEAYLLGFDEIYDAWCQRYAAQVPVIVVDWNEPRDDGLRKEAVKVIAQKLRDTTEPGIVNLEL